MWPIIPFLNLIVIHFGFNWLVTILQWPSLAALL
jgi:hypothetical protein